MAAIIAFVHDLSKPARPPLRRRVARWVSIVAHPFVLIPVLVAITTVRALPPARAALVIGVVLAVAILPMQWIVTRRVRRGSWSDHDVSIREQRTGFYPFAVGLAVMTVLLLLLFKPPSSVMRGTLAVVFLVAVAYPINLFHKISLHTAFAVFFALALFPLGTVAAAIGGLVAVAVPWSRLELRRHSASEVITGAVLGAVVGVALLLWP